MMKYAFFVEFWNRFLTIILPNRSRTLPLKSRSSLTCARNQWTMLTPCFAFTTPEFNPVSSPLDRRKPLTGCSGGTETKHTDGLPVVPLSEPEYDNLTRLFFLKRGGIPPEKRNFECISIHYKKVRGPTILGEPIFIIHVSSSSHFDFSSCTYILLVTTIEILLRNLKLEITA
jgi:hypothetical protein